MNVRVLEGAAITERNLVASALNLAAVDGNGAGQRFVPPKSETDRLASRQRAAVPAKLTSSIRLSEWGFYLRSQKGLLFAVALSVAMFTLYASKHPGGLNANIINTAATKSALLAFVPMAQTIPILTSGLDLSVGMVFVLANCLASNVMAGSPAQTGLGLLLVLLTGGPAAPSMGPSWCLVVSNRLSPLSLPERFTLAARCVLAQGLMIIHTSGAAPQDQATPAMHLIAVGRFFGVPNALWVWAVVALFIIILLNKTATGRRIYAIGNRETAVYLSGVNPRRVILLCFAISGACAALSGVLLAGYSTHAYQAMGDPYLLPGVAAVVLGGTRILGGRGTFLGTVAGVILITLPQSILSVIQVPDAGRQIIYGVVIISMLLLYGRERATQ